MKKGDEIMNYSTENGVIRRIDYLNGRGEVNYIISERNPYQRNFIFNKVTTDIDLINNIKVGDYIEMQRFTYRGRRHAKIIRKIIKGYSYL